MLSGSEQLQVLSFTEVSKQGLMQVHIHMQVEYTWRGKSGFLGNEGKKWISVHCGGSYMCITECVVRLEKLSCRLPSLLIHI